MFLNYNNYNLGNYNLSHRLIAYILLLSLYLQSCSNPSIPMPNGKRAELLEGNKQEKAVEVAPTKLLDSTREKEWLGGIVAQSCLSAVLSLCSLKRGKISRGIVTHPGWLPTYSKSSTLFLLGCKTPFVSTCQVNRHASFTPKLTSLRLQGNKFEEKASTVNNYKPLLKPTNTKEIRVKSYNSPKFISSHFIKKPMEGSFHFSRPYVTWDSIISNIMLPKKLFSKMWIAGGILGTMILTAYFNSDSHASNNSELATGSLNRDNSVSNPTKLDDGLQEKSQNPLGEKNIIKRKQTLTDYRPNDWTHLHYAVQAYEDTGGLDILGWKLIRTSSLREKNKNSYFGSAYCNTDKKHIIIAHRGTEDLKDWIADIDLITRHLNEQEASAWNFSKETIKKYGDEYSYSFTGHSLGGWLALTSLYKYKDEFVNGKEAAYQDAFAVTFDDPGAEELLEALQPRVEKDRRIEINKLDITSYLSYPHIINTAMGHVGSVHALSPQIDLSWWQTKTLIFTSKLHDKELILNAFSQNTGLPKKCRYVIDWPRVQWGASLPTAGGTKGVLGYLKLMIQAWSNKDIQRGEYLGFYTYGIDKANDPKVLPPASQFQLRHGIHYHVEEFDEQKLPLRNMPEVVRNFLEQLSEYPDRITVINQLVVTPIDQELSSLLKNYHINERRELVINKSVTNTTARTFRDKILKFLKANSPLYQNKLSILYAESMANSIKALKGSTVEGILNDLNIQLQHTRDLIDQLSFQQGTARLYKLIKPSWEEIAEIKRKRNALDKQLTTLELAGLTVQNTSLLESSAKSQLADKLQLEMQQLKIAKQSADILLTYMESDSSQADGQLDSLITDLNNKASNLPYLDNKVLLNRAYNLKAKIAALEEDYKLSAEHYKKAIQLLPQDAITWSNYCGLLVDSGKLIEAYRYYEQTSLEQIKPEELPIAYSGKAYGLIMLAQSIEQKKIDRIEAKLPSTIDLRDQARNLLKHSVQANTNYLNAHLFLAILFYDEGNYAMALQEVNNALTVQPAHPTALRRKGLIMDKLGAPDKAIELLEQARQTLEGSKNKSWIEKIDREIAAIKARK